MLFYSFGFFSLAPSLRTGRPRAFDQHMAAIVETARADGYQESRFWIYKSNSWTIAIPAPPEWSESHKLSKIVSTAIMSLNGLEP